MGVPAFSRWLATKYPNIVVDVIEERPSEGKSVDSRNPNPNGLEFDNLYLDMNGIIHPCFHPANVAAPTTYDEVFKNIFDYIDRLFAMVRPRKLLYMAIDGVAPRAKMNQQRSRRFRAAQESSAAAAEEERLRKELEAAGRMVPSKEKTEVNDSNVITPGTSFMESLARALRYYIHLRLNHDPGWHNLKVILSDANSPGEGEHKIMSFIRLHRNLPGYDPNTRHCLYGLDADLIMLALATHEIHFSILREVINQSGPQTKCFFCGQVSHLAVDCPELDMKRKKSNHAQTFISVARTMPFQFLHIWKLREYLELDFRVHDPPFELDFERLVDDFVFMCFFVGNDFLPHMPTLDIREGAVNLLMSIYKRHFRSMGGYLTNNGEVILENVDKFICAVGAHEDRIFQKRAYVQQAYERQFDKGTWNQDASSCSWTLDKVKLGEVGWKERYYKEKFNASTQQERETLIKDVVLKYTEGLHWVLQYYYQGVCSWQWFFPYHYAPFASDLTNLNQLSIEFFLGRPFKPFDQLMGVLPAASAAALPEKYRFLMTDQSSPIIDFYPTSFEIDMNGKRLSWQGVAKLPFIDEGRLLAETSKLEMTIPETERRRNRERPDVLVVGNSHPIGVCIENLQRKYVKSSERSHRQPLDPDISGGVNGYIETGDRETHVEPFISPIHGLPDIVKNKVMSVSYQLPDLHKHVSKLANGVTIPAKTISEQDLRTQNLWHEQSMNQSPLERPPIPNSMSGPELEAAARELLLKLCKPLEQTNNVKKASKTQKKEANKPSSSFMSSGRALLTTLRSTVEVKRGRPSSAKSPRVPAGPPGYENGFVQVQTVATIRCSSPLKSWLPRVVAPSPTSFHRTFIVHDFSSSMHPISPFMPPKKGFEDMGAGSHRQREAAQGYAPVLSKAHQFARQQVKCLARCRRIVW